jgi:hypothetical protein
VVLLCLLKRSLWGTRRNRGGQRGGLLKRGGPAKLEMTARSMRGSGRGRTARRTPKKNRRRIKGRGRKRRAKIRSGKALRVIIVSRSSDLF